MPEGGVVKTVGFATDGSGKYSTPDYRKTTKAHGSDGHHEPAKSTDGASGQAHSASGGAFGKPPQRPAKAGNTGTRRMDHGALAGDSGPRTSYSVARGARALMGSPAEQLDLPPSGDDLSAGYQAHADKLRSAALASELDVQLKGQQAEKPEAPEPKQGSMELGKGMIGVGKDIGRGIIEQPRVLYKGVRDALQSTYDLINEGAGFIDKHSGLSSLPSLQVVGEGAPRIVTAAERAADPSLPGSLADTVRAHSVPTGLLAATPGSKSHELRKVACLGPGRAARGARYCKLFRLHSSRTSAPPPSHPKSV